MEMDVLPVWRSPTINSLWPHPIGILESIAIRPVCNASVTDCLSIIPGAGDSTWIKSVVKTSEMNAINNPSNVTTP